MRTLFLSRLSKVCWIILLMVLSVGYTTHVANSATRATSQPTRSHISEALSLNRCPILSPTEELCSGEIPNLDKFIGFWYAHGAGLRVKANGQAHFEARVYTWCGPGIEQPCDSMQGNDIINGFKEDIQFSHVSGNVAYGTITAGNIKPVGSCVTLVLQPGDQLLFSAGKGMGNHLCGPYAAVGACGA